ncbi:cupin domain-containing protein (plasmid) [Pantoea allii]|uniref:cupin domain-containing protein n=1 Tax=Pantoea allii TaxID=574096 RepID=UPI0015603F8B|nr:cupin domain-containing protein [Pantoea allii]NQS84227.1 cupin domain-containing protein [Pantoea allii]NQS84457.1 cupin domain-containing protein [Pantoea allii]
MISKDNAEHYVWGNNCDGWHFVKSQDLSIIYEHMPPATSETRHVHSRARQFFFILEGQLTMEIEGVVHRLQAQQGIEIPPGARHQARNDSSDSVTFLVISQPTTRGDRADLT